MNVNTLIPKPTHRYAFRLIEYKNIPQNCGCYVLTSAQGEILYIGQAVNLYRRFKEHLDDPNKTGMTNLGKIIWFYLYACHELEISKLERTWMNQFQAKHGMLTELNKISPPL